MRWANNRLGLSVFGLIVSSSGDFRVILHAYCSEYIDDGNKESGIIYRRESHRSQGAIPEGAQR